MKRCAAILLSALLCLALTACGRAVDAPCGTAPATEGGAVSPSASGEGVTAETKEASQPASVWEVNGDITLSLLQDTYPTGTKNLTLVLENRGTDVMLYGQGWSFQKLEDGQWLPVETIENYGFTMEGYTLQPGQLAAFSIGTWFLAQPLEAGYYRVTGCSLRVAANRENLSYGGDYVDCPPYQLEFLVAEDAAQEPDYALSILSTPVSPEAESIPLCLINTTGEEASILFIPHLERESADGTWSEVTFAPQVGFCGMADPLPAGATSWSVPLTSLWGELEKGRYRLSYAVTDGEGAEHTASGEFTVGWELCGYPTADTMK